MFEVLAHRGFASGYYDVEAVAAVPAEVGQDGVHGAQEVFGGHVGVHAGDFAVAPAVAAGEVAAVGAFPEKLAQRMFPAVLHAHLALKLQCHPLPQ